jgi:transketolase
MNTGLPKAAEGDDLKAIARKIRGRLVQMSHVAKTPHLGSSLSCVDILVAAYWGPMRIDPRRPLDPGRDRFILSKGHAATSLYATLACRGFFDESLLDTFNHDGGHLGEHPSFQCAPGVEAATGSLGHGLPLALGMALSQRVRGPSFRCFVLMSDGECEEGTVWEAAMFAPAQRIDNVVVIIDYNKWQATGRSDEIMSLSPLADKWRAFGWTTHEVDGHDLDALGAVLRNVPDGSGRPIAVVAHTVKGRGVSFMEDDNNWHYRIPTADEVLAARKELGLI